MAGFNSSLGLKPGENPGEVTLDARPEHEVGMGFVHFAVLATVAEVAAAGAAGAQVVPAQISLSLLSTAKVGRLVGRGKVIRRGRRLIIAEGEVWQDDALVAKAIVTFSVVGS
jgi:acyl-coenzyme A thioesterase PaaI-like protein